MTTLSAILVAVFSVGGAGVFATIIKGINGWRAGAARTEARAIQNLERYRNDADWRAQVEANRAAHNHDVAEYWRDRAGNAEFKIRTEFGAQHLPPVGPIPVYVPLERPADVVKVTDDV
jgi:hypothetical protein